MLRGNLDALLSTLPAGVAVVLVDDGSRIPAAENPDLAPALRHPSVHLISHPTCQGAGAARNTALQWCRVAGVEVVILLDSDCTPAPGFVEGHLDLHRRYPGAACIGAAIQGHGKGPIARLDGVMSWFTSMPGSAMREVKEPLHLPTTNMSLKLAALPATEGPFDPRLRTGEDVALNKRLRATGKVLLFSPEPVVIHRDRETLAAFFSHQMRWALHTYAVRFGPDRHSGAVRLALAAAFLAALPLYAGYASWLNMRPVVERNWRDAIFWPAVLAMYGLKGLGLVAGTLCPRLALIRQRPAHGCPEPK